MLLGPQSVRPTTGLPATAPGVSEECGVAALCALDVTCVRSLQRTAVSARAVSALYLGYYTFRNKGMPQNYVCQIFFGFGGGVLTPPAQRLETEMVILKL